MIEDKTQKIPRGFAGLNEMLSKGEPRGTEQVYVFSPQLSEPLQARQAQPDPPGEPDLRLCPTWRLSAPRHAQSDRPRDPDYPESLDQYSSTAPSLTTSKWSRLMSVDKWVIGGVIALVVAGMGLSVSKEKVFPTESKPAQGNGMSLSDDQIRYCLSETIRIDSWQSLVDHQSTTSVDAFNLAVSDYNSRCSDFKYRRGALERVRAEVEGRRAALQTEGSTQSLRNP